MDTIHAKEVLFLVIVFFIIYCTTVYGLARHILMLGKKVNELRDRADYYRSNYAELLTYVANRLAGLEIKNRDYFENIKGGSEFSSKD